jgi:hypothetical protein
MTPTREQVDAAMALAKDDYEAGLSSADYSIRTVMSLVAEIIRLRNYEKAIDDALIVRHIGVAKDEPEKELGLIIDWDIQVHDDPRVSEVAAKREAELLRLREKLRGLGELLKRHNDVQLRLDVPYCGELDETLAEAYADSSLYDETQDALADLDNPPTAMTNLTEHTTDYLKCRIRRAKARTIATMRLGPCGHPTVGCDPACVACMQAEVERRERQQPDDKE